MSRLENTRTIDLVVYVLAASFTAANAAWAVLDPHRLWGQIALTGAIVALLGAVALPNRRWTVWAFAAFACVVVPTVTLSVQRADGMPHRAQSEVIVIETAADRLVRTGSPYLDAAQIDDALQVPGVGVRAYVAYGTTMAVFGLPRAWFGVAWWTDARIWFLVFAAGVTAWALRIGLPLHDRRLRVAQAITIVPPAALTIATGGDDLPMLAMCLLGLALGGRRRWRWAAVALGLAVSMKYLALPVAVTAAWWAFHDEATPRPDRARNALTVIGATLVIPALTMAPALVKNAGGVLENLVRYPLGLAKRTSTAASPLPGRLIADHVPGGHVLAPLLLLVGAAAVVVWMWRQPPRSAVDAAACAAVALAVATLLAPSPRFGYLIHPIVLAAWSWAARTGEESPRLISEGLVRSPRSAGTADA